MENAMLFNLQTQTSELHVDILSIPAMQENISTPY